MTQNKRLIEELENIQERREADIKTIDTYEVEKNELLDCIEENLKEMEKLKTEFDTEHTKGVEISKQLADLQGKHKDL